MKKIALILVFALMTVFAAAVAEEAPVEEMTLLEGVVLEVREDGYLVSEALIGQVLVLVNEDTVVETTADILPGDYIYVDYNGMMTRSIPAQITASVVRMYKTEGDVIEFLAEDNAVRLESVDFGEIIVNLPESYAGQTIDATHMTVYFNGAMTMSLPAQIGAGMIVPGYTVQGVVTEITDEYVLIGEGMSAVQVNFAELPEEIKAGDAVRVTFDGMMSYSIPAQITAESFEIIHTAPIAE